MEVLTLFCITLCNERWTHYEPTTFGNQSLSIANTNVHINPHPFMCGESYCTQFVTSKSAAALGFKRGYIMLRRAQKPRETGETIGSKSECALIRDLGNFLL